MSAVRPGRWSCARYGSGPVGADLLLHHHVGGFGECGKTVLLRVFAKDTYPGSYVPTMFENYTVSFEIDRYALRSTCGILQVPLTVILSGPGFSRFRRGAHLLPQPTRNTGQCPQEVTRRLRNFASVPRLCWLAVNWTCGLTDHTEEAVQSVAYLCYT